MKKIIIIFAVLFSLQSQAQNVLSKALGDSIIVPTGAFEVQPVIVDALGDSARSFSWVAISVTRDTTTGFNTYCQAYTSTGVSVSQFNCYVPKEIANLWAVDPSPIDDFILSKYPRFIKVK
jgi:hypothetical protein